jgi:Flp pilus assembly protein TadG
LRSFAADCRGNIAIISAFAFLPMLLIAGGATDIARYESYRVQLQDGVDRAVLAAASLTQTRTVEQTVEEYLKSLPFIDEVEVQFASATSINSREITVTARYPMQTGFLPLIGINSLTVAAAGTALERRSKIELSVILDISGSMAGSKYTSLKSAATQFVRTMLTERSKAYTTISVVPYAGQVNVGAAVFNGVGGQRVHNNSSCFELRASDFAAGLMDLRSRPQVPHFTKWNDSISKPTMPANMGPAWCPSEETSIAYLSNDADYLATRIAGFQMYDGTGSAIGINWGLLLLDPAIRPLIGQAISYSVVGGVASGRPADFNDPDTLKVIVLMTDGAITEQYTAVDPTKDVRAPSNAKLLRDPVTNQEQTTTRTRALLSKVCTAAKNNHVLVFTIGFQIGANSTAAADMRNCASSPGQYFDVAGLNIASAFESIATAIQNVRLTQ